MDCSLSHPACHILSFLNFLLAWKWIISHHFKRVLPGLPGKLSTVCTFFEFSLAESLPRRIFDKRKRHLARWPSPGHQLPLCLTGSRHKSGNAIWNSLADKPWKISRPYDYLHSRGRAFARPAKCFFCSKPCVPSTF